MHRCLEGLWMQLHTQSTDIEAVEWNETGYNSSIFHRSSTELSIFYQTLQNSLFTQRQTEGSLLIEFVKWHISLSIYEGENSLLSISPPPPSKKLKNEERKRGKKKKKSLLPAGDSSWWWMRKLTDWKL